MALLQISPYIAWKGIATNSAVPGNSRPDLNAAGPHFKAQPINHWRKQLMPTANSGGRNRRAGVGMPMDTPGGSVYLGDVVANTNCLANAPASTVGIKENIMKFNNTNFKYNDEKGCLSGPCNPEKTRIKSATTILSKKYYTDHNAYLRSRGDLYDQKLTALPVPGVTYLDTHGNLLYPNSTNTVRNTQDALDDGTCPTVTAHTTIYKPNNIQYAKQGAVDSSDRLTRLKLNTINKNAASYKAQFNTTAPRYLGAASTPYFLKSKYQVCVPMKPTGTKRVCSS
jgi:hypothetical protein